MRGISFGNLLVALIFIFIGGWLVASNMGLIDNGFGSSLLILIEGIIFLYGLWSIFQPLFRRRKPHWFMGLFGTAYGGLLLANEFGYVTFHWGDLWRLWPLFLVYIGLEMLGGFSGSHYGHERKRYKKYLKQKLKSENWKDDIPVPPHSKHGKKIYGKGTSIFNLVKEYAFNEPNWQVEPLSLSAMIGGYEFDFTVAYIPDRETEIRLSGWVGDIDILIPEDVAFMVRGGASITTIKIGDDDEQDGIGRNDIQYKTPNFDEAARRLVFDLDFKILDMRIDRV
jgi:lia operon protein LiaF